MKSKRPSGRFVLVGVGGENARQLGGRRVGELGELGRGGLDQADQLGAQLVERGQRRQRLDVRRPAASCPSRRRAERASRSPWRSRRRPWRRRPGPTNRRAGSVPSNARRSKRPACRRGRSWRAGSWRPSPTRRPVSHARETAACRPPSGRHNGRRSRTSSPRTSRASPPRILAFPHVPRGLSHPRGRPEACRLLPPVAPWRTGDAAWPRRAAAPVPVRPGKARASVDRQKRGFASLKPRRHDTPLSHLRGPNAFEPEPRHPRSWTGLVPPTLIARLPNDPQAPRLDSGRKMERDPHWSKAGSQVVRQVAERQARKGSNS